MSRGHLLWCKKMPVDNPRHQFDIRALHADDRAPWVDARCRLWSDCSPTQALAEVERILRDGDQLAVGAFESDALIGFAEYSLHPHAIGCATGPVAYLEAWWVAEDYRRSGVGRKLVDAGVAWGRSKGCSELASDTWIDNVASDGAHRALGFEAVERLIHYRRSI